MNSNDVFEQAVGREPDVDRCPLNRPIRRMWTFAIACVGVVVGLLVAARSATPGVISTMSTAQLFGVLVLAFGPVTTLLALRYDRHLGRVHAREIEFDTQDVVDAAQVRSTTHDAHVRPIRVHTRVVEAVEDQRLREQAA